ncbi:MAG: anti-sigma factor antagonist [Clostridia bacterium]|nr:anti-sigma factor antagonist [Clostridia bacterium]
MKRETCKVTFGVNGGRLTALIKGEIDHHNAKKIRAEIDAEIMKSRPAALVLDLSEVTFMDSSGLGLILGRYSKASDLGIAFSVSNPTGPTQKILDLAGMERIIRITRDKVCDKREEKAV